MRSFIGQDKAQSSLEFALVIVAVALGLLAMQVYLKQGLQGRLRNVADNLGSQYDPVETNFNITDTLNQYNKTTSVTIGEEKDDKTSSTTTVTSNSTETSSGTETLGGGV